MLASTSADGEQGNEGSSSPSLSADGNRVAFATHASNLVPGDANAATDVFVKDLATGAITLASASASGCVSNTGSLSADGGKVAFHTFFARGAVGLVTHKALVKNLDTGTVTAIDTAASGEEGNGFSYSPMLSADGTKVAFGSDASNLVRGDTNRAPDVFVRDLTDPSTNSLYDIGLSFLSRLDLGSW